MKAMFVEFLNIFNDQHGVYSLSAMLKKNGIDVGYVKRMHLRNSIFMIKNNPPDVLLYSSFTASIPRIIDFDKKIKELHTNIKSVIRGHGVTFDPFVVSGSTIDAVCIGEGETVFHEFILNGFKPIRNIFVNGMSPPTDFSPLINPDSLPFPDRDLVYNNDSLLRNLPSKQFFSGRGCPYRCSYCFNRKYNDMLKNCGPVIRKKALIISLKKSI
ncbi:MAG: cobalamin-dependent protein [Magnetococcales bacterium]|nr:cobalamin-dependent protein [Magnetococcales bacterium]